MIPKIIHFCWLSGDPYPQKIRKCMKTWKRIMPDYEVKLWNMETFDISTAPIYVQEAIKARKMGFRRRLYSYVCTLYRRRHLSGLRRKDLKKI